VHSDFLLTFNTPLFRMSSSGKSGPRGGHFLLHIYGESDAHIVANNCRSVPLELAGIEFYQGIYSEYFPDFVDSLIFDNEYLFAE